MNEIISTIEVNVIKCQQQHKKISKIRAGLGCN